MSCHISNKVYGIIINDESCVNVNSTTLVRKLSLNTTKQYRPYRL
jgi:hypothetical protein